MNKGAFANENVMEDYLSALLGTVEADDPVTRQSVAKLLENTDSAADSQLVPPLSADRLHNEQAEQKTKAIAYQAEKELEDQPAQGVADNIQTQSFQALFFDVAGLTLAVPLTELGGIHQLEKIGPLFGKPDWFKGVMLHREEKLKVVDTAKWVMPEKYDEKLADSLNYQYLIMLDESGWGLACERLVNTATLQPADVKWRESRGKRPWLAGMVKDKMCALVDVKQLVALLDQGLGSNDL